MTIITSNWLEFKNKIKWDKEGDYIMIKVTNHKKVYIHIGTKKKNVPKIHWKLGEIWLTKISKSMEVLRDKSIFDLINTR